MDSALVLAGLAMGAASSPHCMAMCSAPCASVSSGCRRNAAGFHTGRVLGYMAGGAIAASSVAALGAWGQVAPALRPVWTLVHLAFAALGLWWLLTGRSAGSAERSITLPVVQSPRPSARPWRSTTAGLAWVAWPCGALQGALLLSALASGPVGGALVMGGFALASLPALAAGPWVWTRWRKGRIGAGLAGWAEVHGLRLAGFCLLASSGWALTHGIWERLAAWCLA
ncbi:MAG TPA: sulfite exporter TauE/SafE family protein [Ideonella sp.]|uniref:sulfite exporter TauE/SafE family protein n=1 Tax=Ideonella sp. TaxID=1929293 RepID=UPI002E346DD7|nr:sulfite exporter TauE/SafE family protein [Ideonella sp.]HEX5687503.1 sulfite exporter TauE/SafE family protein [Ideonella sp.]